MDSTLSGSVRAKRVSNRPRCFKIMHNSLLNLIR